MGLPSQTRLIRLMRTLMACPRDQPREGKPLRDRGSPQGVEAPRQDLVPFYEYPIWDRGGNPILDYTVTQDMVGWWSQGAITDWSQEKLGRTDVPIIFLRRQLEQNIRVVEDGATP